MCGCTGKLGKCPTGTCPTWCEMYGEVCAKCKWLGESDCVMCPGRPEGRDKDRWGCSKFDEREEGDGVDAAVRDVDWYSMLLDEGWVWLSPPVVGVFGQDRVKVGALVREVMGETDMVFLDKFTESIEVRLADEGRRGWFEFSEVDRMLEYIRGSKSKW